MSNHITFTLIDAIKPPTLAKEFNIVNGKLQKLFAGHLTRGQASTKTVSNLAAFGEFIVGLTTSQVLLYGIMKDRTDAAIVSRKQLQQSPELTGTIARIAGSFCWPEGAAILMLDIDHDEGRPTYTAEELVETLRRAVPELKHADMLHNYSSSSMIFDEHGNQLAGARGHRIYIAVTDGRDIPRFGEQLQLRLWSEGLGYFAVSKSGALLERTSIDGCVWQPNRLDLAAGAQMGANLQQKRGTPRMFKATTGSAGFFDSRALMPDVDPALLRRVEKLKSDARNLVLPVAKLQKEIWKRQRIIECAARNDGSTPETDETLDSAIETGVLHHDFILQVRPARLPDFEEVTVGNVLANPLKYDQADTRDPLEPDYRGHATVGKLYLHNGSHLHSLAHGGRTYLLAREIVYIMVLPGETHLATDLLNAEMRKSGIFFDQGDVPVMILNGRPQMLTDALLSYIVAKRVQFTKPTRNGRGQVNIDPPDTVLRQTMSIGQRRNLPVLMGTCGMPILRPDGSVMGRPGFDRQSKVYGDFEEETFGSIPDAPDAKACRAALAILLAPFVEVQFEDEDSHGVLLAALLTALCRPVIEKAPAFVADASSPGSGKSMICEALGYLMTGHTPSSMPPLTRGNEEENRKRSTAALLPPAEQILFFDNQNGRIDSPVLSQFLTAATITDRILGVSKLAADLPNRALVLVSGNNIEFSDELSRRNLKMRLSVPAAGVFQRHFTGNVLEAVAADRGKIVTAGLTLMSAALRSHDRCNGPTVPSYPEWDRMVRQTILWINRTLGECFVDPLDLMEKAMITAPDRLDEYPLLDTLSKVFENRSFIAADLLKGMDDDLDIYVKGMASGFGSPTTKSVGIHLSKLRDRVIGDLVLRCQPRGHMNHYRVENISSEIRLPVS
ncbi:hypothetical protein [Loktanella salsilacus]|uniref:hypothetical protein n=1 Tax=Loktanella salsilacus TaxID=195913 RepID=UPI0030F6B7FD